MYDPLATPPDLPDAQSNGDTVKHVKPAARGGHPALNVKDDHLWARDPRLAQAYAELEGSQIEAAYEQARERFWEDVDILAMASDYAFHQDGRNGGWLVVTGTHFLDDVDIDQDNPYDDLDVARASWQQAYDASMEAEGIFDSGQCLAAIEVIDAFIAREAFLVFAGHVDNAMDQAGDYFLELLREAVAELHDARENVIVRGEN